MTARSVSLQQRIQENPSVDSLRCAIYTRVSTDNQAEKVFNSCEAQAERITSFINSQENLSAYKIYSDEGYTGANTDRPELTKMLQAIQQGEIDRVIVYKIDRLTRSPKDFYQLLELFEKYGASLISVTEMFDTATPSGRLLRNIMLTFAQFERELISERTRDKLLQKAQKGYWHGGAVPLGYRRYGGRLIIYKREAQVVIRAFDIYIQTASLVDTFNKLSQEGITNRNGNHISKSQLSYMLRNTIYIGKLRHNDAIYQGIHKPIISDAQFSKAQEMHKEWKNRLKVHRDYLFCGLIRCSECASIMTPHYASKRKGRYFYYRCTATFKHDWQACATRQVSADRLESFVLEQFRRVAKDRPYIDNLCYRLNHDPQQLANHPFIQIDPDRLHAQLLNLSQCLESLSKADQQKLMHQNIKSMSYSKQAIIIQFYYLYREENTMQGNKRRFPLSITVPFEFQHELHGMKKRNL